MPAQRVYTCQNGDNEDVLKFEIEGDLEDGNTVYFTDQSPSFTVTATNTSDKPIDGHTWVRISFDESSESYGHENQQLDCTLDSGESNTVQFELDMLSYQGNAAITIDRIGVNERDDEYNLYTHGASSRRRIYTFMIYDRDYYKVNYLYPRYAQYIAAILSVGIIGVGVLQLLLSL